MKNLNPPYLFMLLLLFLITGCEQDKKATAQVPPTVQYDTPTKVDSSTSTILNPEVIPTYSWLTPTTDWSTALVNRVAVPDGYVRNEVKGGSFAEWLRFLPLQPQGSKVMYFNGEEKPYQQFHEAVIDIDIGNRDLQQCADATMRLRAEYQYGTKQFDKIKFNFTSGDPVPFSKWRQGYGITISKNRLKWVPSSKSTGSYASFKRYMKWIYMYAGTASLSKEITRLPSLRDMQIGDLIIQGGFPGHAVIVVDMAYHPTTGDKLFLLAQSYMPAQSIHILKNPFSDQLSPWYSIEDCLKEGAVLTTQWNFLTSDLGRFK